MRDNDDDQDDYDNDNSNVGEICVLCGCSE